MRLVGVVLGLALLGSVTRGLDAQGDRSAHHGPQAILRGEEAVVGYLGLALAPGGEAARIYFHTSCGRGDSNPVPFPPIRVRPPLRGERGVEAVREMFQGDRDVRVVRARSGIVRIEIGDVYTRVLKTRLPSVRLSEVARYNPNGPAGAIIGIENAKAVRIAMHKLRVRQASVFYEGLVSPPLKRLPHLPPLLKNATMDQMLDSVAETFRGVVIYGECMSVGGAHVVDMWLDWFPTDG